MAEGAFKVEKADDLQNYNIEPIDKDGEVPKDQADLQAHVYGTRGVLKLLNEQGLFEKKGDAPSMLDEFSARVLQLAEVGLTAQHAQTALAAAALEQLRGELLNRKGKHVIYRYLQRLAGFAAAGAVLGVLIEALARFAPALDLRVGYGFVIAGAMAGAWLSAAANRRDVTFDELPGFLASWLEPIIRIGFVGLLAAIAALFVETGLMTISIGGTSFATFREHPQTAVLLGLIAGIGERALSVRVLQRAGEFVAK